MNRQIKFRVWNKKKNDWEHGPGYEPNLLGETILLGAFCNVPIEDLNELEVCQFTGLQDSEGREIYEGDIITWDDASQGKCWRVAQVTWHERGTWCYNIIPGKSINCFPGGRGNEFCLGNFIYTPNPSLHGNVLKVIGNIFENPELVA